MVISGYKVIVKTLPWVPTNLHEPLFSLVSLINERSLSSVHVLE